MIDFIDKYLGWITVSAIVLILSFGYFADYVSCERKSASFDDYDYSMFGGCMVLHNDRWLPLDNIRGFE